MVSHIPAEDLAETAAALQRRVAQAALRHVNSVEPRAGTLLELSGLAKDARKGNPDERRGVADAVANVSHPRRVPLCFGPLVAIHSGDSERLVVDVSLLLVANDAQVRAAGMAHFGMLASKGLVTPKTQGVLKDTSAAIASADLETWAPNAVRLYDAVKDDIFCVLAGLDQSLSLRFDDGINDYLARAVRPTVSSLDSIDLQFWTFTKNDQPIKEFIDAVVRDSESIENALDTYFERLGHVALGPDLSAGALLRNWLTHRGDVEVWSTVWTWAESTRSTLARYHAAIACLNCLSIIPRTRHTQLLDEVAQLVAVGGKDKLESPTTEAMAVRELLARHYAQHFECHLPWSDSERATLMAWWLAERLARVFERNSVALQPLRKSILESHAGVTEQIWKLAHPPVTASPLRYATLRLSSLWSFAVLRHLLPEVRSIDPLLFTQDVRGAIDFAMQNAFVVPWVGSGQVDGGGYAFSADPVRFVSEWLDVTGRAALNESDNAPATLARLVKPENFIPALRTLPTSGELEQVFVAHLLMAKAYDATSPDEAIWELLSKEDWLERILLETPDACIQLVFEAVREIVLRRNDRWAWTVPHVAAAAYNKAQKSDRKDFLFAILILWSIAAGTVSAIQRILSNPRTSDLDSQIGFWRARIDEVRRLASPWVASRLRPIAACLT